MIAPKSPDQQWIESFLAPNVKNSQGYKIAVHPNKIKLDQNEMPYDWPLEVKKTVCEKLINWDWNRYPPSYHQDLEELLANHVGVNSQCILLSPGSNHLITLIMNTICLHAKGQILLARPSFPLYEEHASYFSIAYKPWLLTHDYQFDIKLLENLPYGSVVVFASPNNPTGTSLSKSTLARLLENNPSSFFIADEAYFEFSDDPYTDLLTSHHNLIIIRTFSKTLGAAALRLGYLIASSKLIAHARKLLLPFLINPFTYEAAKQAITHPQMKDFLKKNIDYVKKQRTIQFERLAEIGNRKEFKVYPSEANFFMLKWINQEDMTRSYQKLLHSGCLARDISKGPGLSGCLRISIGTEEENDKVYQIIKNEC